MKVKNGWKENDIDNIWWNVHKNTINKMKVGQRRIIQKFIHNKLPTNERQQRYYNYKDNICKACNTEIENQHYIYFHAKDAQTEIS